MAIFVCDKCGFEEDYDESAEDYIECPICDGTMVVNQSAKELWS